MGARQSLLQLKYTLIRQQSPHLLRKVVDHAVLTSLEPSLHRWAWRALRFHIIRRVHMSRHDYFDHRAKALARMYSGGTSNVRFHRLHSKLIFK